MPPGERPLEAEARAGAVHTRAQLRVQIIVSSHELAVKVSLHELAVMVSSHELAVMVSSHELAVMVNLHESAACGARACSAAGSNRGFQVLALPESGGLRYKSSSLRR